jgi:hypothetical protein
MQEMAQHQRDLRDERERKRFRARRHSIVGYLREVMKTPPADVAGKLDKPVSREQLIRTIEQTQSWCAEALKALEEPIEPTP